jgi:ketopantoate reductase
MDLKEVEMVRQVKREMEHKIKVMIQDFERSTRMEIRSIDLEHITEIDFVKHTISVKLNVELGH